jgi:hypothetical protein
MGYHYCSQPTGEKISRGAYLFSWCIDNASRGELYSHFKREFILEPYLLRLKRGFRTVICKLRTCNTKFRIETGRWQRVPKNERIWCNLLT